MKGRIYQVDDRGKGGPGGFSYKVTHLCIDATVHVTRYQRSEPYSKDGTYDTYGTPTRCDGSCIRTMEIPDDVAEEIRAYRL